jgi:hypothetical protein
LASQERELVVASTFGGSVESSTQRLTSPSHRRGPAWAVLASAVLSMAVVLFWGLVLVDALRHATGWALGRPTVLLVGAVLSCLGVVGSVVALVWRGDGPHDRSS